LCIAEFTEAIIIECVWRKVAEIFKYSQDFGLLSVRCKLSCVEIFRTEFYCIGLFF